MADKPKTLLAQVRDRLRLKNYSYATEKSYIGWIRRYLLFHQKRHPAAMGRAEVEAFLTHLAETVNASGFRQSNYCPQSIGHGGAKLEVTSTGRPV
jgi:hypothetical protein